MATLVVRKPDNAVHILPYTTSSSLLPCSIPENLLEILPRESDHVIASCLLFGVFLTEWKVLIIYYCISLIVIGELENNEENNEAIVETLSSMKDIYGGQKYRIALLPKLPAKHTAIGKQR